MVTVYHHLTLAAGQEGDAPKPADLELAGIVFGTDDLDEAFDLTIHRDGENWTDGGAVQWFGDRRSRRSSQEVDIFVKSGGEAFRVLARGFQHLPGLHLPFL